VSLAYVLDSSVMVAALRSNRGASRQLLLGALDRRFELLLSVPLMLEYEAVLTRAEHLSVSGVDRRDVERVLDDVASVARPVRLAYRWRPQLPDPKDDMVLETAVNGNADAVVTFNRKDFAALSEKFDCRVLLPRMALLELRGKTR
jgi:putative PIN family toxin of toxin-antitoxin system